MIKWAGVLIFLGVILLLAELFMPGFGVFGVFGILAFCIGSLILAYNYGTIALIIALIVLVIIILIFFYFFRKKRIFNKVVLKDCLNSKSFDDEYLKGLIGKVGITVTTLRPNGKVDFGGKIEEVFSEGNFISNGVKVKVIDIQGKNVIVKQIS